jgi:Ca2+-binding EF-hand superfamily protein
MRKILLVAAGAAALATAACGLAQAQSGNEGSGGRHGIFQSDSNSDGVLTRAEFDAGRTARFARLDADNNGQLTREEMHAQRGERGERGHRGRGHRGGPGGHLNGADANNDGNITREEFLARPIAMFERLDANSNGVIEASERPQRPERGAESGERRQRADRPNPDADGNGTFSRAEFTAMGAHMFERLDANSDGRVTQEEAQAAHGHRRGRH